MVFRKALQVIKAQTETGKIFQVGSQGVSSLGNEKQSNY
jgi:hypothetical protein